MGTISDKLMRIINTKEDIRRALISKGYDVPTSIPFKEYAKMILDLPCNADSFPDIEGIVARYSALGLTNEHMAENPVWKDITGNGHDLQMKNFAWKGMSGVGGYGDENYQTFYKFTLDDYVFIASPPGVEHMNFTFRVTGLQPGNKLTLAFFGTTNTVYGTWDKDGIYTVNSAVVEVGKPVYFYNGYGATRGEFTIEILPLYPGALVFDGVDDYGVCDNFPVLTKEKGYTVVALRQWLTPENKTDNEVLVANLKKPKLEAEAWGAFGCEIKYNNTNPKIARTLSFGSMPVINVNENNVLLCQTSNNYNGVDITSGNDTGGPYLLICSGGRILFANAAIWELIILDHDATEEELTKIKDYFVKTYPWLFPDQAWTVVGKTNEDEDRATIANITGNGNDLVLSNFDFAEGSGYGLYKLNFNNWFANSGSGNVNIVNVVNPHKIVLEQSQEAAGAFFLGKNVSYSGELKISVSNKPSDIELSFGSTALGKVILNEGINIVKINPVNTSIGFFTNKAFEAQNIIIEQIPEYEGYLVTDGVDDKIVSSVFGMGKDFTIVGDWKFMDNIIANAGISKTLSLFVYNTNNGLRIFINNTTKGPVLNTKTLKAICSDGRVYSDDWSEMIVNEEQPITSSKSSLLIGINGNNFAKIALKNLAIYNQLLSKDDCIKAYNHLQTLKSK